MQTLTNSIEFWVTLAIVGSALAAIGLLVWRERKPRETLDTPLIPTTPVMLVMGLVLVLALVHLVNLAGIHTGR